MDLSDLDVGDSLPSEILSRVILELTEVVVPGVFWGDDKLLSETIYRFCLHEFSIISETVFAPNHNIEQSESGQNT